MNTMMAGVVLALLLLVACWQPEPAQINLTAQDCAHGGCYAK